ncbi:uncharacterized protein LOC112464565, partial [Temnothorax curvispinosus]|uniref:Uncharacterized protein LOC112464565 n=1 Tax=Temnothorax curvispinosus TaxID=300111 RepID=A0A6J1R2S7_9HYME
MLLKRRHSVNDKIHTPRHPVTIPYIKGCSESICKALRNKGFDVVYTVSKKLDRIINSGKDRLASVKRTELVYEINCLNCEACYIGQTKRNLETRIKEHRADIKKHPSNHSVVSKHKTSWNHNFNWSRTKVLHSEKHFKKREIAEM